MVKSISLAVLVLLNACYVMSQINKKPMSLRRFTLTNNSRHKSEDEEGTPNCECPVSIYVVVLLTIIILFMLILISFLSYALYKTKLNVYKKTITTNTKTTIGKVDKYMRQDSKEVGEFSTLRKISSLDSPFKRDETSLTMVRETNANVHDKTSYDTADLNTSELEPKPKVPINKRSYPVQALILPAQMDRICKDVLSKMNRNESMSLTRLNEIVKEEAEKKTELKLTANDKCASLPVIDDCTEMEEGGGEYDILPRRPVPLSSSVSSEELMNSVYDCVPHQSERAISDRDGNYVMPLLTEGPFMEPSYVNAKEPVPST